MKKKVQKKSSVGIEPLGDRVLVKELDAKSASETKSGIIIPETVGEDKGYKRGMVVAVGKGRFDDGVKIPMSVSVGDSVLFQWGDVVKVNGQEYHIVSESNILAVVK
jgi:chaperonin GroES